MNSTRPRFDFPRTFGQEAAKESLRQALAQGRMPHALLLHGEPGLGQHALLLDLAQILCCEGSGARPCRPGSDCPACRAFRRAALETLHYLIPLVKRDKKEDKDLENDGEEALESDQMDELAGRILNLHENPYGFSCPAKASVSVGQIRHLLSRLRYAESRGSRMILVPYLEALNDSAANALLKALEEPPDGVYFLIASERRGALLPTLLSRCLHLGLTPLPDAEFRQAAETLARTAEKPVSLPLLPFAEGAPGAYLQLLEDGESLLEEASRFFSAATAGDWRVFAEYAEQISEKDPEETLRILRFLLRCLRLHQSLRVRHPGAVLGREDGYRWTSQTLGAEGLDPSLSGVLGPLEDVPDFQAFSAFLDSAHKAVRGFCRPRNALLGLFLEYEAKAMRRLSAPAGIGRSAAMMP